MPDLEGQGNMKKSSTSPKARGSHSRQQAVEDLRRRILQTVEEIWRTEGRSPAIREIGAAVGIRAPGHIKYHVDALVEQGLLRRLRGSHGLIPVRPVGLRISGEIAAGNPLDLFDEGEEEVLELDALASALPGGRLPKEREVYALRVRGDSMVDDGILDGDYVLIAPSPSNGYGTIAVALHRTANGGQGEATLKWVYVYEDEVHLRPANAAYDTRVIGRDEWDQEWEVQGALVGVYRQYFV
jgi:repressor LexA